MGLIKYKDNVIYEGPLGRVQFHTNWCDSMATYYPWLAIEWVDGAQIRWIKVNVSESAVNDWSSASEIVLDKDANEFILIKEKKDKDDKESRRLGYHKMVKVVRGRKVPIGTKGEIFWMGSNKWGKSIGLRLLNGDKVFTAENNVEVITIDEAFEEEVLK